MYYIPYSSSKKEKTKLSSTNYNASKIIQIFFIILALGIISQMIRWQIIHGAELTLEAQEQYRSLSKQASRRGSILTENGTILAIDEPRWKIYASLSSNKRERELFFQNKDRFVAEVSAILEIPKKDIEEKLSENFRFVLLQDGVTSEKKDLLQSMKISDNAPNGFGIYAIQEEKRIYPNRELAAHVVGFIGKDTNGHDIGMYGIEGFYSKDLKGEEGHTYKEKDSRGNVILTSEYQPIIPRDGKDIVLTIDPGLQAKVEKVLAKDVQKHQAKSGSVIIMEPTTGKILVMANYPTYDPNEYWKAPSNWIYKNKAVADVYEYGSVHKPITVAIGLETNSISPDYICNDKTGSIKVVDKTIYTWNKRPNGKLDLAGILSHSNNPCIVRIALKTGHKKYYPKLKEFGIGEFIGLGLEDESNSYLKPYDQWTKVDLAVTGFGQSISATPVQIISAINTIANDGKRMRPYIISEIKDKYGDIKTEPKVVATPISPETAKLVRGYMRKVVTEGEARRFFAKYLPQYDIAGKTGTAQIPKPNSLEYYKDRTNTTFVGFAPVDHPKIIMLARLEEPGLNTFSASTVVPMWIDIFKEIADDLEIPQKSTK